MNEMSDDGRHECAYYWLIRMQVHTKERMVPLRHSTLRQLEKGLLHKAMSERKGPLYGCGSMIPEMIESWARK